MTRTDPRHRAVINAAQSVAASMRALVKAASVIPPRASGSVSSLGSLKCAVESATGAVQSRDLQFHGMWLRDHCRCPACYNSASRQRQVTLHSAASLRSLLARRMVPWSTYPARHQYRMDMYRWRECVFAAPSCAVGRLAAGARCAVSCGQCIVEAMPPFSTLRSPLHKKRR